MVPLCKRKFLFGQFGSTVAEVKLELQFAPFTFTQRTLGRMKYERRWVEIEKGNGKFLDSLGICTVKQQFLPTGTSILLLEAVGPTKDALRSCSRDFPPSSQSRVYSSGVYFAPSFLYFYSFSILKQHDDT